MLDRQRNTAAAHDLAHQLAATARPTHDLPDRRAGLGQAADGVIGLLPPQISFVLQALGMAQQGRVDDGAAERHADGAH